MQRVGNVLQNQTEWMKNYQNGLAEALQHQYQTRKYECDICKDDEFVFVDGWTVKPCVCQEKKRLKRRMESASIPAEYNNANFDAYKPLTEIQKDMYTFAKAYLDSFEQIKDMRVNSFGFLARIGESRIRSIRDPEKRFETQKEFNNYGVGKTYLAVAIAKKLIDRGYSVLLVSDAKVMDQLSSAKAYNDEGETFNRILSSLLQCDVLLWDELGKSKPSDTKMKLYFRIFDDRYERRKPVIFTSNEDDITIGDCIGNDARSRILGMSSGRYYAVTGPDLRLGV